jgi:hypothetical protein
VPEVPFAVPMGFRHIVDAQIRAQQCRALDENDLPEIFGSAVCVRYVAKNCHRCGYLSNMTDVIASFK